MTTFTPSNETEVVDAVHWAAVAHAPLEVIGTGSKRLIGRPSQTEHTLDLHNLSGVSLYEPEELVLSAYAATPLKEINLHLSRKGQQLAFEPMDYGPLLGLPAGQGTIGGLLATNLSGPRRLSAGAARDHILGVKAVSGRGEVFKSGGRVVKNVTGYDMSKLLAGSWGTLAVVTELTFKVLPVAEAETTLAVRGLLDEDATAAMAAALGSSAEVSSAAHLPEGIAGKVAGGALGSDAATLLRLEGFPPSITYRLNLLEHLLRNTGELQVIEGNTSKAIWRDIRDCIPFADGTDKPVWRVSMSPSQAHRLTLELRQNTPATSFYDWQGGLVWLRMEGGEPEADALRAMIRHFGGGHATLVRASPSVCAATPVFEPSLPGLAALSQRVKAEFDPNGILNPGRMS
jgi:glycolate oxidase FAD binding subunit